jgi:hypothetical protein
MQKREVVLRLLVPANEQTAKAVHPGMCPLHHPTPRFEPRFPLDCFGLFPARTHMRRKAEFFQRCIDLIIVVASIQAHPLWLIRGRLWPCDDQAFDRCADQLHLMPIRPLHLQADRDAMPLGQQAAFDAGLAPVGGIGPGFFPRPAALS